MIRTTITPDKKTVSFEVPDNYIGKQLEIIAFAKDEGVVGELPQKNKTFTVLHVDIKDYKFDRDEANER